MAWADYQRAFYDKVWAAIVEVANRINVDPRIIFAQAALESNWGRSELTTTANNFFGIKASRNEPYVLRRTREVINGASVYVNAKFREYSSVLEGIAGYGEFITRNPRYRSFINATNLDDELAALQRSGYATDPQYANKLRRVINNMPFNSGGPSSAPNTDRPILEGAPYVPPGTPGLGTWYTGAEIERELGDRPLITGPSISLPNPFNWLKDVFSLNTGARVIAIVLGLAFVIVAVIVLLNSDTMTINATPVPA